MMELYVNKFTYDYADKGVVTDAQVGIYGNDSEGQYVSCNLVIKPEDLGKKDDGTAKTFDDVTITDISAVAKAKMLEYLQDNDKKATDK